MERKNERDYVLGTTDEELERLGLQHRVWRPTMLECWQRAGVTLGSRVLDIGAGPGYATVDLAEIVGSSGEVVAVERSNRFVQAAQSACTARGLSNVRLYEIDLMTGLIPAREMDVAWCRWVASFISSPKILIAKLASVIKPGGVAIFHEYIDYSTWRVAPRSPAIEEFVQRVMESWRAAGGEPDIALTLPTLLTETGFRLRFVSPRIFCAQPTDFVWQWPASFINVNLSRLLELGLVDQNWVTSVRREFDTVKNNRNSLMLTPLLLEIIAERTTNDA